AQRRPGRPRPRRAVLVPVYNEVATVRALLARVMAVPIPKEIIVVDDGSTDGTRAVLEEMHAATPATPENRLVVLFQERNQGKGAAVRRAAGHVTGEIALGQDADLGYDPPEYPRPPRRPPASPPRPLEPSRPRARADRQRRPPALPGLRGADRVPRPAVLRGQEDRLEGRRLGLLDHPALHDPARRRARGRGVHPPP